MISVKSSATGKLERYWGLWVSTLTSLLKMTICDQIINIKLHFSNTYIPKVIQEPHLFGGLTYHGTINFCKALYCLENLQAVSWKDWEHGLWAGWIQIPLKHLW
jgi:hypothetical protein